jgi:hypothetical protein
VPEHGEGREVLSLLTDRFGAPFLGRIGAGIGQPERRDSGGDGGRGRADVEARVRRDRRLRHDVPPSEPFGPDDGTAAICQGSGARAGTHRHGHPGQVLLQDGRAHDLPRALDGRGILWRRRRAGDRWHLRRLREERHPGAGSWLVVCVGQIDAHGGERQPEGDKGEGLHRFSVVVFMPRSVTGPGRGVLTKR